MIRINRKKSLIFITPDYHCSFIYRDKLREFGWHSDIYVPFGYPKNYLYSDKDILLRDPHSRYKIISFFYKFCDFLFFIWVSIRYKYHIYYGALPDQELHSRTFAFLVRLIPTFKGQESEICLRISKFFGCKIMLVPSGCKEIDTRERYSKFDEGNVCANCGWGEFVCNDVRNNKHFELLNKYGDIMITPDPWETSQSIRQERIKYKALDLNLWHPSIRVPDTFKLRSNKLKILHSSYEDKNRNHNDKDIKGSMHYFSAINKLIDEGFEIEHHYFKNIDSRDMRYYQVQADIIVDQLIYGWWGSTALECMALGKPVICYLNPEMKESFFTLFPEYESLPIIESDVNNIYGVLKNLIEKPEYRIQKARESREFAERHFDIKKNAIELEKMLLDM